MSARLSREFIDHVPWGVRKALPPRAREGMAALLLELDDRSREGCVGRDDMARWVGALPGHVSRDVFNVLVDAGLIERVMYETKSGPVAAVRGKPPRFRVPRWCDKPNAEGHHDPAVCFPLPVKAKPPARVLPSQPESVDPYADGEFIDAVRSIRSTWAATAVRSAIGEAVAVGCDPAIARRAMVILAEDPESDTPRRLMAWPRTPLMAPWFIAADKEAAATRKRTKAAQTAGDSSARSPKCDYTEDPGTPGWCKTCGMPKANARHLPQGAAGELADAQESGTVVPFRQSRAKRSA